MPSTVPQSEHEPHPDPQALTSNPDPSQNAPTDVDYTPHPESSIQVPPEREAIVKAITDLYSGSASKEDVEVYAEKAVYDDPWSFCDTRYKIAGQWYGMSKLPPSLFSFKHRRSWRLVGDPHMLTIVPPPKAFPKFSPLPAPSPPKSSSPLRTH